MDFLSSVVAGVVSKIGELLVEPILEQCEHLIHPNKSINNLKGAREQLNDFKQALKGRVDADRRNGLIIAPAVEKWFNGVEDLESELQQFYEDEVKENNQQSSGRHRYSLGKRAAKKRAHVVSLKEEGQKFSIISYPPSPPHVGQTFTANIKGFQSRTEIIEEVIEKLKNDEFKRISICGIGGVGKTTMVKQVIKMAEANKLFDGLAFAVISQNVNYEKVQEKISEDLGLQLQSKTPEGRASEILRRLKSINKVLIVLDDVWSELDFECIGLPSSTEYHTGLKTLFTSRDEQVCYKMGSQENFIVPILSSDEAWDLFAEMAGRGFCNQSDIYPIAKEIADECGGLPIVIVTIGKALVNKRKHTWEDILDKLKTSPITSFSEMQESVYSRIQLSYNFLGSEEHRDCLLLCCLFPEDSNIPIEVLMRHGLGLELFEGVSELWKARNRVHDLVDNLKSHFLLLDSEEEECVKMHDVVREAVILHQKDNMHIRYQVVYK